jgi:hypothetical protein
MTYAQRTAIITLPQIAQGLVVYQTDSGIQGEGFYYNISTTTTPNWVYLSSVGPTGPTGAVGVNGATGVAGANGATGATGTNGATGVAGANGATGATGTNGATGVAGANGATGANGTTVLGATGAITPCIRITGGELYQDLTSATGSGITVKSPNGNCWKITVDNNGNVTTRPVTCIP